MVNPHITKIEFTIVTYPSLIGSASISLPI